MSRVALLGELISRAKVRRAGEDPLPILSMTMENGLVDQSDKFKKRVASADTSAYKRVTRDQLVVGFPIDEGVLSFQRLYDEAIVSPAYDVWDVCQPELVNRRYLERVLRGPKALAYYRSKLQSTTARRRTLPEEIFLNFQINLPSLDMQAKAVALLDKADSLQSKRQKAIRLADKLRLAVFVQMLGDPDLNPKGWPILPMGDVIEFKGGSQPPKETFIFEEKPGYVRLVQIRDFKSDKYKTYIPEDLAKRSFVEDDVMVARYGPPVFQILRGLSGSYNVALMKAQPRPNVLKEFIFWLLQLPKYQSAVISNSERTAGQTGVNLDFLNSLEVPLPPLAVQEKIASTMIKISSTITRQQTMLEISERLIESLQVKFFE